MDKDERKHISNITDEEVSDLDDTYDFRDYNHGYCLIKNEGFDCKFTLCVICPLEQIRITFLTKHLNIINGI